MNIEEFKAKWLEIFAAGIPEKDIDRYVFDYGNNTIWHVFSWELLSEDEYLTGDAAKHEFDSVNKQGAKYIIEFQDGEILRDLSPELSTAADMDKMIEVYTVGKDFSWTYIKTHELVCGPYFCYRKK
jgi:hypothetical protein